MTTTSLAERLTEENHALKAENAELKHQLNWLKEQIKLSRKQAYGASSEKSIYDFNQIPLFNEAEYFADEKEPEPKLTTVKEYRRKTRLVTDKLPPELPVETVEYTLPEKDQICPKCNETLHRIGKETVREELKIIPAKCVLVKHVRHSYGCRKCELNAETPTIIKASAPEPVIKGSFASPEAVAHIMVQKFIMGVPIYRQEKDFNRQGILLSRQTMSNWLIKCTEDWLVPIYDLLHKQLLKHEVLFADETELQVLREPGRTARQKSYLWVYRTGGWSQASLAFRPCSLGDAKQPDCMGEKRSSAASHIVLSEYQPGRHGKHAAAFLDGFKGYLHTDGYAGYHNLSADIVIVGCWSHARRLYDQALKALSENSRSGSNALRGKQFCDELFNIERKLTDLTPDDRSKRRIELAQPVLDKYYDWLTSFSGLGKTLFSKAVNYSVEQWKYLKNYMMDGRLELSNNRTERTIKMFVIDRKNFLFANTPRGARASAVMFSIVYTAIENGFNPYDYLVYIFKNAPNWIISDPNDCFKRLLPHSVSPFLKTLSGKEREVLSNGC
jgi:transposase